MAPQATLDAVLPAFAYLSAWFVLVVVAFAWFGFETRGRSIEDLDAILEHATSAARVPVDSAHASTTYR